MRMLGGFASVVIVLLMVTPHQLVTWRTYNMIQYASIESSHVMNFNHDLFLFKKKLLTWITNYQVLFKKLVGFYWTILYSNEPTFCFQLKIYSQQISNKPTWNCIQVVNSQTEIAKRKPANSEWDEIHKEKNQTLRAQIKEKGINGSVKLCQRLKTNRGGCQERYQECIYEHINGVSSYTAGTSSPVACPISSIAASALLSSWSRTYSRELKPNLSTSLSNSST